MNQDKDQAEIELRAFFKKRRTKFLIILLFIPVSGVVVAALKDSSLMPFYLIVFAYYIFRTLFQIGSYQCPKCRKTFTYDGFKPSFFTAKCGHCGFHV